MMSSSSQSQPVSGPSAPVGDMESSAARRWTAGQEPLFARTINPAGYPIHVIIKETDWRSAVGASCFYMAMGRDHKAWAWMGEETLRALIATLQEALPFAKDPGSSEEQPLGSAPEGTEDGKLRDEPILPSPHGMREGGER